MKRLSRKKIVEIFMTQDCTKCPYDAVCTDSGCAVKALAAKLLLEDLHALRSLNRRVEKLTGRKGTRVRPAARTPITVEWHDSEGEVCKVTLHGYMPWNMEHFRDARIRANLSNRPYRKCWFCSHPFALAEVPVGITVAGIGNRFACSSCYEKVKGDG